MHVVHDEGLKAVHFSSHLFHEKSFWGIVAIFVLLAALFTLITLFGDQLPIMDYHVPAAPYGAY